MAKNEIPGMIPPWKPDELHIHMHWGINDQPHLIRTDPETYEMTHVEKVSKRVADMLIAAGMGFEG